MVDAELVDAFRRDGAVCLRGAFTEHDVALVTRGIERNLAEPSELALVASRPDDPGRFFEDFRGWQRIPEYEEFIRESAAAQIAGELMDSRRVRLFHDHVLVKEPATRQPTPWHQDQPYYNVDGRQVCSLWMPVDPVDRESTVEFVAGSHLGPLAPHIQPTSGRSAKKTCRSSEPSATSLVRLLFKPEVSALKQSRQSSSDRAAPASLVMTASPPPPQLQLPSGPVWVSDWP